MEREERDRDREGQRVRDRKENGRESRSKSKGRRSASLACEGGPRDAGPSRPGAPTRRQAGGTAALARARRPDALGSAGPLSPVVRVGRRRPPAPGRGREWDRPSGCE